MSSRGPPAIGLVVGYNNTPEPVKQAAKRLNEVAQNQADLAAAIPPQEQQFSDAQDWINGVYGAYNFNYTAKSSPNANDHITPVWLRTLLQRIHYPGGYANTDVNRTAVELASNWLLLAIKCNYNLTDPNVREAFVNFCLMVATYGEGDKDMGTTTTGVNTQGKTAMGAYFAGKDLPK